jgi:hypothetical protein
VCQSLNYLLHWRLPSGLALVQCFGAGGDRHDKIASRRRFGWKFDRWWRDILRKARSDFDIEEHWQAEKRV